MTKRKLAEDPLRPAPPAQSGPAAPATATPTAASTASPAPKKRGIGSKIAGALTAPLKLAGDHIGAMAGSGAAIGRLDLRIAHGDMMDRMRRWMAVSNLRPTPRNIVDFISETYGENAARMAVAMFKEGGVDFPSAGGAPSPAQGNATPAQPAAQASTPGVPIGVPNAPISRPAFGRKQPAAPARRPVPMAAAPSAAVKRDINGLAEKLRGIDENRLNAALVQIAADIKQRHPTETEMALKEIRAEFITDKESARVWHAQRGNEAFGLTESRDAARRMIGRPLEERRVIVNRVHALLESGKSSTTEAGQIATSLQETMKAGLSLREAWRILLAEATAKSPDDEIDRATLDQITKVLAGGLVRANIIQVNNRYDRQTPSAGVSGGGDDAPAPRSPQRQPAASPQAPAEDDNEQEQRGQDLLGVKVNRRKMQAPLQNANIIASDQALMIAQLASFYGPQDYVQFKGKAEQTARSDSYAEAIMKDPYLAVFAIVKALQ